MLKYNIGSKGQLTKFFNKDKFFKKEYLKLLSNIECDNDYLVKMSYLFLELGINGDDLSLFKFGYKLSLLLKRCGVKCPINHYYLCAGINPAINPEEYEGINGFHALRSIRKKENHNGDYLMIDSQREAFKKIKDSDSDFIFEAPTSYGKSEAIYSVIKSKKYNKVVILEPTITLISQVRTMISEQFKDYRIIMNVDEEYEDEEDVIFIYTQERLQAQITKNINFRPDVIFIDEAHNLIKGNERTKILSRSINLCLKGSNTRIVYLTPSIGDVGDIIPYYKNTDINHIKISFDVKIPFFTIIHNKHLEYYDPYLDDSLLVDKEELNHYYNNLILRNKGTTLTYLSSPSACENMAVQLCENLEHCESEKLVKASNIIKKHYSNHYKLAKCVKRGVVYIHGKVPNNLRTYLLKLIKENKEEIKFIIGNSAIIEGMNFPVNRIAIVDPGIGINQRDLNNLIGRSNRLNMIFEDFDASKLMVPVDIYTKSGIPSLTKKRIKSLVGKVSTKPDNEISANYNGDDKERIREEEQKLCDDIFINNHEDDKYLLSRLISSNILKEIYFDFKTDKITYCEKIIKCIRNYKLDNENIFEIVRDIFIKSVGKESISDNELKRLINKEGTEWYYNFHKKTSLLKYSDNVKMMVGLWKKNPKIFYVTHSYGDTSFNNGQKVYYNTAGKSEYELHNIAIIKCKLEEDFISYKINSLVKILHDFKVISEYQWMQFRYGTSSANEIKMIKQGYPRSFINDSREILNNDHLTKDMIDQAYSAYLKGLDDLQKSVIMVDDSLS